MHVRSLSANSSLHTVRQELVYTVAALQAHGGFEAWVAQFLAMIERTDACLAQQLSHEDQMQRLEALAVFLDRKLDGVVDRVDLTTQTITGRNRNSALYQLFFGRQTPAAIKRPVLGAELDEMHAWPSHLEASGHPELQEMAKPLAQLIAEADQLVQTRATAQTTHRQFRSTGAAAQLLNDANALRSQLAGELDALARTRHSVALEDFFRESKRSQKKETPASLAQEIADLEGQVGALKQQREALLADAASAAQAKLAAEQRQADAEFAAAKAAMEAAGKRIAELAKAGS